MNENEILNDRAVDEFTKLYKNQTQNYNVPNFSFGGRENPNINKIAPFENVNINKNNLLSNKIIGLANDSAGDRIVGNANTFEQNEIANNNKALTDVMNIVRTNSNDRVSDGNISSGKNYYDLLLEKESSNNYSAVNRLGYLGGYQMGASALADVGLVKKGTSNKSLDNPKNWIGNNSKKSFLNNPGLQNIAVREYTEKNKKYLGNLYKNASADEKAGLLGSAHLIGAGATRKDMNSVDANGVSGNDRYTSFYGSSF